MKVEEVEIVPDPADPRGGRAVIRLKGVWLLPPGTTLRIEPVDGNQSMNRLRGWPRGDLRPRTTRVTGQGVELLIGSEIVDAPGLLPGTPVRLKVSSLGLDTVIVWPKLPLTRLAQLRNATSAQMRDSNRHTAPEDGEPAEPTVPKEAEPDTPGPPALPALAKTNGSAAPARFGLSQLKPRTSRLAMSSAGEPDTAASPAARTPPAKSPLVKSPPAEPPTSPPAPIPPTPTLRVKPPIGPPSRADHTPQTSTSPPPARASIPTEMPRPVVTRQSVETAAAVREHRSGLASSIAIALASLCIGALAAFAYRTAPQIANMSAPRPAAETRAQPATESTGPIASPAATASLAQVFHAPPVSPRGIAADTRDTPAVLRAANDSLHGRGDTPKDREEAAYWLRTALSRQLSGPGMSWALTQLGAYYAAPEAGTEPDYARARLLWEIAATQSDPVANCFLGQLAEFGLGQPKDPAAARTYYADAVRLGGKQQSGCHGLEAALARLSD